MKTKLIFSISCILVAVLFLTLEFISPLRVAEGSLCVSVIFLSLWINDKQTTILLAFVCTILILGGFYSNISPLTWNTITDRLISIVLLWTVSYLVIQKKNVEEQHHNEIIHSDRILAICQKCKQIRDEDGKWTDIDTYLNKYSEVIISSKICPHCSNN